MAPLCFLGFGFFGLRWGCLRSLGRETDRAKPDQHVGQLHGGQIVEDDPFIFRDGDHHPAVGYPDLVGHVIARDLFRDYGLAMSPPATPP